MISSTYIRDYLLKKFDGKYKILSGGREMVIPSLFVSRDPKRHMSINLDTGLWQCFKSQKKGNFIHLYSELENLSYKLAYNKFLIDEFFSEPEQRVSLSASPSQSKIEEEFNNFKSLEVDRIGSIYNSEAVVYLVARKLIDQGPFYYCDTGLYKGRLIIPYTHEGRDIFFQGRALYSGMEPKYLNYKGVKASAILYPFKCDSTEPLYICEGVFDALSLKALGYNATTTMSCYVSKDQMSQLKYYNGPIVVAYDSDDAGLKGLRNFEILRRRYRMPKIYYTLPPKGFKDWNEAYVNSENTVHESCKMYREFNLNEWDTMTALDTLDQ